MSDAPSASRRRRRWLVAAGLAVVAGGAVAVVVLAGSSPPEGAAPGRATTVVPSGTTDTPSVTAGGATTPRPGETTAASDLTTFAPSEVAVFSSGTVRLGLRVNRTLDLIGWFAVDNYGDGHIAFTQAGLVGRNETSFALLADGADTSFETCRTQTTWTAALTWPQLRRGSFACLRTYPGRVGILRVDEPPDLAGPDPATVLTGTVWDPIVDR